MRVVTRFYSIRAYLLIIGGLCLSYGIYQKYWYADLIGEAVKAIEANRLDEQQLEMAKRSLFAPGDLISYNMGVRAYRANNLKNASENFYDVIGKSHDSLRKKQAYYNLGNILVQLELPKKAVEMYQESLRLDPTDWESKYNLERLYVFYSKELQETEQASLEPEPKDKKENKNATGQYGPNRPDI